MKSNIKDSKKAYTPYERVQIARDITRPGIYDYINAIFDDFVEMHGDRLFRDDPAIVGGIASINGIPVTVIGHRKGKNTEDNVRCNFGMASPEGYRKAKRLMEQAEKFNRPIITIVDTPGAYPGLEAETNGQSNAIAENIAYMSTLKVPTIAIITGEGSSGGALAIAMSDKVWMLENAVYSILSPEGFATIMWKDAKRADEAAKLMKITAGELYEMGLIDEIIPEGDKCIRVLSKKITEEINNLRKMNSKALISSRYEKYRKIGKM